MMGLVSEKAGPGCVLGTQCGRWGDKQRTKATS